MSQRLAPYRKLLAVLVGLALAWIWQRLGVDLSAADNGVILDAVVDGVLYGLTALAVYWFPNRPLPPKGET